MKLVNLGIAALSLVVVGCALYWESRQMSSPGALHPSHALVTVLQGPDGCAECHGTAPLSMDGACVVCHETIGAQIENDIGVHGILGATQDARCVACHFEHTGGSVALVSEQTFSLIGVHNIAEYAHEHVGGFELEGVHQTLDCEACHDDAHNYSLLEGERRYLGLSQACVSCHEDPHDNEYGSTCVRCHGQDDPFDTVASFEHDLRFPLADSHAGHACRDCHDGERIGIEDEESREQLMVRACSACHESPHREGFIQLVGARIGIGIHEQTCGECHSPAHESFGYPDAEMGIDEHALTGFPLVPPHESLECVQCHGGEDGDADGAGVASVVGMDGPVRHPDGCAVCHGDPHGGQFVGASFGTACLDCHDRAAFAPSLIDAQVHEGSSFGLTGAHVDTACFECHTEQDGVRRYVGTPDSCAACHEDPHQEQFVDAGGTSDCAACHGTDAFVPSTFDEIDHEANGFPLVGEHTDVACIDCHTEVEGVAVFRGAPTACAACHDDPHNAQFREMVGGERCDTCHTTGGFVPALFGLDDHSDAGFELDGAHLGVACVSCHVVEEDVQVFAGTAGTCADCHEDVHQGVFERSGVPARVNGVAGCARCHTTGSFADITLTPEQHGVWTEFALEGAHAGARCAQCHIPDEHGVGRNTLGIAPRRCDQCHTDPHMGQFRAGGETVCALCHGSEAFVPSAFDHQTQSSFELDEFHETLSCGACHQSYPVADGKPVIRYRPLGNQCEDCHDSRDE